MELLDLCKSSTSRDDKVEPMELLDEYWFFENLLHRKTRMLRSSSDPSPSSNNIQEMVVEKQDERVLSSTSTNLPRQDGLVRHNLLRTPSLPPCIGREKMDEEIIHGSSKLIRQASLGSSDVLPRRQRISKTTAQSPGIPRYRARRESKVEGATTDSKNHPCLTKGVINRSLSLKSQSDLEFEEVQGFKDLGFIFDEEDLNPSVANIIPGLQGKKLGYCDEHKVRRPYLSEAWLVQRSAPPMLNWVDRKSAGDMKEQLKFWARAVASNVR